MLALQSMQSEVLDHGNADYSEHRRRTEGTASHRGRAERPLHGGGGARHTSTHAWQTVGPGRLGEPAAPEICRPV
ncbi:hypothetical protein CBM2633_A70098 [Cupriavidus taiwanensis]|nr:hypothetical protein CBM2633_A70098 [Cupriavidus taiwanensis]